jgi:hypothetical protein
MSSNTKEIQETVEKIFVSGSYLYSEYIYKQLKKTDTLKFVREIIDKSTKTPSEALFILLAAIRYIKKDLYALIKLEEANSFESFINEHHEEILNISINKKVQGNGLERGLPILEILSRKLPEASIYLIELGASYGLIGSCLLNSNMILEKRNKYFHLEQRIPENSKNIDYYLGIDIDPPDKEWLLSCFSNPNDTERINTFIEDNKHTKNFQILKASALGFSKLKEVRKVVDKKATVVILTSFMLYQLNDEQQKNLEKEIEVFIHKYNGHWIRQEVEFFDGQLGPAEYNIEWDGSKIIKLNDDRCTDWKWLL